MGNIYLARHGEDEDNKNRILNGHREKGLTVKGRAQAKIAANKLKLISKNPLIIHSPLKRTFQTATIIASVSGTTEMFSEPMLIERDFGILTGKKVEDIKKYSRRIVSYNGIEFFCDGEGVESFENAHKRAMLFLKQSPFDNFRDLVLVTHGDIGKMLIAAFYNHDWEWGIRYLTINNADIVLLDKNKPRFI
jgi:broad specificity phosphatase PhoE